MYATKNLEDLEHDGFFPPQGEKGMAGEPGGCQMCFGFKGERGPRGREGKDGKPGAAGPKGEIGMPGLPVRRLFRSYQTLN